MNFNIRNLVIGLTVALPVLASAQEDGSHITREQVRAELVALENAGYHPNKTSPYYPADIQAAEAKIHAGNAVGGKPETSYGGVTSANPESAP
ncbi:DUF4148 domain-containing protein [Paraburkholderia sp. RL17-347-BIC-D]|uniref:DUF4148 domain-containing protein n=1 Tax=Paraburkholderia sp. RL17-347-BIC-D TaxID=3031632 RepID=UPI0038BB0CB0